MSTSAINPILGARVKHLRNEQRMTRETLAEALDVSTRFLADVEAGKVGVSLTTLTKLCRILNTSADYLLGLTDPSATEQELLAINNKLRDMDPQMLPHMQTVIDAFIEATK